MLVWVGLVVGGIELLNTNHSWLGIVLCLLSLLAGRQGITYLQGLLQEAQVRGAEEYRRKVFAIRRAQVTDHTGAVRWYRESPGADFGVLYAVTARGYRISEVCCDTEHPLGFARHVPDAAAQVRDLGHEFEVRPVLVVDAFETDPPAGNNPRVTGRAAAP